MRGGLVALAALLSSCFTPRVEPCALECAADQSCPPGSVCLADGFCHGSSAESLCSEGGADAGIDAAPADGAPVDAGPECGNGRIEEEVDEECDDGGTADGDGCDGACAVELRFVCTDEPSVCRPQPQSPGDVLITEIMKNPTGMGALEENREWFEVHNPTATDWDLLGVTVEDDEPTPDSFTIDASLPIAAGASLLFATSDVAADNGGLPAPDFVYSRDSFILANNDDEILLFVAGSSTQVLDRVDYNDANFPDPTGASMSLDPASYDDADNDVGANWCEGSEVYGDGSSLGTPGQVNPACQ